MFALVRIGMVRAHTIHKGRIVAATGQSETNGSVLSRSIRLANCLTALGLVLGDVLALSGKNHLDISLPFYAALFNGLPLLGVDPFFKIAQIKSLFKMTSPKIAFCDPEHFDDYVQATRDLSLDIKVFTFGDGPHSMKALIEEYGRDCKEEDFLAIKVMRLTVTMTIGKEETYGHQNCVGVMCLIGLAMLDGEHPLAFVVRNPGCDVTAQEIKDLVANELSEKKQLRGGVVFLQSLPVTSTGKVSLAELRRLAQSAINVE